MKNYSNEEIFKMLLPKLKKHYPDIEHQIVKDCVDWSFLLSLCYKSGYIRGQLGRSFIIGEKKTKNPLNTFKVGGKVKFLGLSIENEEALSNRRFYPPVNTIGEVVESDLIYCVVRWPKGITLGDGIWRCRNDYLEKVTECWVPATKDNVKIGSKVRMIDGEGHRYNPEWLPNVGTVGIVMEVGFHTHFIQWPEGSTSESDIWYCDDTRLEVLLCE